MKRAFIIITITLTLLAAGLYWIVRTQHLPQENTTRVVIYTTTWCPYCEALRNTLHNYNIAFTEYDVENSWSGRLGYWILNGQGVPVSVIGENIIRGYDGQVITDALSDAGYQLESEWPNDDSTDGD